MTYFTVIIVNLNNADGLKCTLSSVASQSFSDKEVIVVDGGSQDESLAVVKSFKSIVNIVHSGPDTGIYNAMNKGLSLASGRYVVYMNSGDCFFDGNTLEKVSQFDGDIILGGAIYGGEKRYPADKVSLYALFAFGICHQSTYYKRDILVKYPFDEGYSVVADLKTVVEPYAKDKVNITVCHDLLSICEGGGMSKVNWRMIHSEKKRMVDECLDPFYAIDYRELIEINPDMLFDFSIISRFASLRPMVRVIRKGAVIINAIFKKIPL